MRVLVTGATGFIGSHLLPALAAEGHDVHAVVRSAGRLEPAAGVTPVECDLNGPVATRSFPEVEAIVHLAQANVRFPEEAAELYRVNTVSTQALLDHARAVGARRFVLASSGSVYGYGPRPFAESDPPAARDFYSVTKMHAEQLVASYQPYFENTVLRLFAPYGPGQEGRLIPSLIKRVRDGEPLTLNGGGQPRMNPIYVGDVVRAVLSTLEQENSATVNVAGEEVVGIRELGELIAETIGVEAMFEAGSDEGPGDLVARTTLFRERYGSTPLVPLAEGLERTAQAARATGVTT